LTKSQQFELSITSQLSNLNRVADFISESAHASGLNEKQTDDVQMAVDEAVTNIIEHAYAGRHDGRIYIYCERRNKEFIVEIQDFGKPFDPSKVPTPRVRGPLSTRTIGGLGIFFMRKLMNRVEFSSDTAGGNRVRMAKRVK
jgi:serine/threonine-protein kinase RsbW